MKTNQMEKREGKDRLIELLVFSLGWLPCCRAATNPPQIKANSSTILPIVLPRKVKPLKAKQQVVFFSLIHLLGAAKALHFLLFFIQLILKELKWKEKKRSE